MKELRNHIPKIKNWDFKRIFELIWNVKDGIPRNAKDASRTISSSVLVLVGGGSIDDGDVVDDSDVVDDGGAAVVVVLFCVLLFKFLNFNKWFFINLLC